MIDNGHFRLRKCQRGAFLYLVNDRYIGKSLDRYGEFSEGEIDLFRQLVKPGMIVVEIGANIGAHTVFLAEAAKPTGIVYAFEPQRILFQVLCANIANNGLTNVRALHAASGHTPGKILVPQLDVAMSDNFGALSVGEWTFGDEVPVTPLDSLALEKCDFIKIDVEGMEGEVISGAEKTITRFRPIIYAENDRQEKSPALIQQLFDLDYRLWWHLPKLFRPDNYFGEAENIFSDIVSVNLLCVPKEIPVNPTGFREVTSPEDDWRQPMTGD